MKKYAVILLGCLLLSGCKQEVLEPEQQISGSFALDDGSGLTTQYLEFDKGYLTVVQLDRPRVFAENKIWNLSTSQSETEMIYTISEGNLHTKSGPNGPISQKDGTLTIGTVKYSRLDGFEKGPYSRIVIENNLTFPDTEQNISVPYSIEHPITSCTLKANTTVSWIYHVQISGSQITFKIAKNNFGSPRTGTIKIFYGNDATAELSVTQSGKLVQALTLNKTTLSLHPGDVEPLSATVDPSDATLSWSSSNTSVAAVSSTGWVNAVGNGSAIITASATDGSGKKATCTVTVTTLVTGVSLNKSTLTLNEGASETLTVTISPSTASNKSVTWSSTNTSTATVDQNGKVTAVSKGTATVTATANDGSGIKATCAVTVKRTVPTGAVDLGLSVLWATCNLGTSGFVSSPEVYGEYYSWGETATKSSYSWSTYKWCNGSSTTLTKYNNSISYGTVDNMTVLDPADDVANVKLGGNWRMPTDAEWTELRTKCTWTWTTNYNGTGVKGIIVTASNGNSIFRPDDGYRYGTNLRGAGSRGYYWSSSLSTGNPSNAWYVLFDSGGVVGSGNYRYRGLSVRPVSE